MTLEQKQFKRLNKVWSCRALKMSNSKRFYWFRVWPIINIHVDRILKLFVICALRYLSWLYICSQILHESNLKNYVTDKACVIHSNTTNIRIKSCISLGFSLWPGFVFSQSIYHHQTAVYYCFLYLARFKKNMTVPNQEYDSYPFVWCAWAFDFAIWLRTPRSLVFFINFISIYIFFKYYLLYWNSILVRFHKYDGYLNQKVHNQVQLRVKS